MLMAGDRKISHNGKRSAADHPLHRICLRTRCLSRRRHIRLAPYTSAALFAQRLHLEASLRVGTLLALARHARIARTCIASQSYSVSAIHLGASGNSPPPASRPLRFLYEQTRSQPSSTPPRGVSQTHRRSHLRPRPHARGAMSSPFGETRRYLRVNMHRSLRRTRVNSERLDIARISITRGLSAQRSRFPYKQSRCSYTKPPPYPPDHADMSAAVIRAALSVSHAFILALRHIRHAVNSHALPHPSLHASSATRWRSISRNAGNSERLNSPRSGTHRNRSAGTGRLAAGLGHTQKAPTTLIPTLGRKSIFCARLQAPYLSACAAATRSGLRASLFSFAFACVRLRPRAHLTASSARYHIGPRCYLRTPLTAQRKCNIRLAVSSREFFRIDDFGVRLRFRAHLFAVIVVRVHLRFRTPSYPYAIYSARIDHAANSYIARREHRLADISSRPHSHFVPSVTRQLTPTSSRRISVFRIPKRPFLIQKMDRARY